MFCFVKSGVLCLFVFGFLMSAKCRPGIHPLLVGFGWCLFCRIRSRVESRTLGERALSLTMPKPKSQTEKSLYLTSMFPHDTTPVSLPPRAGSAWFVDEKRSTAVTPLLKSRSLTPRFAACLKQMGDSGNWHRGLWHAVMALSPEIPHLYLSSCCLPRVCSNAEC